MTGETSEFRRFGTRFVALDVCFLRSGDEYAFRALLGGVAHGRQDIEVGLKGVVKVEVNFAISILTMIPKLHAVFIGAIVILSQETGVCH
jgi:hypothetical protein